MLGRDVVAAVGDAGHEAVALARADLDITNPNAVQAAVTAARPDAIINCAAWTDVDGAETAEAQATAVNGRGAGLLAHAAAETGALLVHVSSDYVFDGTATEPYAEDAPTGPQGATGAPSWRASRPSPPPAAASRSCARVAVRPARQELRGHHAAPRRRARRDRRGRRPGRLPHLHRAPRARARRDRRARPTGVMHVAGGGHCTWFDLAKATFEETGLGCHVSRRAPPTSAGLRRDPPFSVWRARAPMHPCSPPGAMD